MTAEEAFSTEALVSALRAAGEPTRLRLLAVLSRAELTVTELTQVMGQSQPRVSRHLKLLSEAGLVDRIREGTWVFYRAAESGPGSVLASILVGLLPSEDPTCELDRSRLEAVRQARAEAAAEYFKANARQWDQIRSLYVSEASVEREIVGMLKGRQIEALLDLGTGTGRMLEIMSPHVGRATGVDQSHDMLAVARANLEKANIRNCQVRHGDIFSLPFAPDSFDAVVIHQVLHYLDDPASALMEAARVLAPGGQLVVADFAPHELEFLRDDHAHRRLGLRSDEVATWCRAAGLDVVEVKELPPEAGDRDARLTVSIWRAERADGAARRARQETTGTVEAVG